MQLQAEPVHDDAETAQRLLRICLASTEHDGVVRVSHQLSQVSELTLPDTIESIQVDAGQQRRDHTSPGTAQLRALYPPFDHYPRMAPLPKESPQQPLRDPPL